MPSISQTVIDFLLSPPIGVLKPIRDTNGPFGPGDHTLTDYNTGLVTLGTSISFGVIVVQVGPIPAGAGFLTGFDDGANSIEHEYFDRFCQLCVQHQLQTGAWVTTQLQDVNRIFWTIRWSEALPGRLGLHVDPNSNVDLLYLVVA